MTRARAGSSAMLVAGEAGVGKTRLVAEFADLARGVRDGRSCSAAASTSAKARCRTRPSSRPCAASSGAPTPDELDAIVGHRPLRARPARARISGPVAGRPGLRPEHRLGPGPVCSSCCSASSSGSPPVRRSCSSSRTSTGPIARRATCSGSSCATSATRRSLLLFTYRSDELHRRHPLLPFLAELERSGRVERLELQPFDLRDVGRAAPGDRRPRPRRRAHRVDPRPLERQRVLRRGAARRGRRRRPDRAAADAARRAAGARRRPRRADPGVPAGRLRGRPARRPGAPRRRRGPRRDGAVRRAARVRRSPGPGPRPDGRASSATRSATPCSRRPIYDDLLPGERTRLHSAFARTLEATGRGSTRPHAAELAYHWYAAHDLPRALESSVAAGLAAEARVRVPGGARPVRAGHRALGPGPRRRGAGRRDRIELLAALAGVARFHDPAAPCRTIQAAIAPRRRSRRSDPRRAAPRAARPVRLDRRPGRASPTRRIATRCASSRPSRRRRPARGPWPVSPRS